jgi:3-phytase
MNFTFIRKILRCIFSIVALTVVAFTVVAQEKTSVVGIASLQLLGKSFTGTAIAPVMEAKKSSYLMVDEVTGVQWLDATGKAVSSLAQATELLDWRTDVLVREHKMTNRVVIAATVFLPEQQPGLVLLDTKTNELRELLRLPVPAFKIENLCLSRDAANNLSLFILDERGTAEHWLLVDAQGNQLVKHLRNLPIPPNSKACAVDDKQDLLFVAEEAVGVWAYGASVETAPGRMVVDMAAPFGNLLSGVELLATVPNGLLAIAPEEKMLLVYRTAQDGFQLQQKINLNGIQKPEALSAVYDSTNRKLNVLIYDKAAHRHQQLQLAWDVAAPIESAFPVISLGADVQTQVMARFGDAADDPAIWVNKKHPQKSRVIGTNKQQGLFVYDMHGRELQHFNTGKLNNVDVRYGVSFGKKVVDIAVATNRDDNSLAIYTIDPTNGKLSFSGSLATDLEEIYGFCLYQSTAGAGQSQSVLYAIPNSKTGEFQQIQLTAVADSGNKKSLQWQGKKVRSFFVKSQPEGCVADDMHQQLFVGEEDVGVWTIGAEPAAGTQVQLVMPVGDVLVADVEGMGIYQGKTKNYLVVSSQGNNTYVIMEAAAPYKLRGIIRIDLDAEKNIDGVSETDGLDVTHLNMGPGFSEGMLVVQDGHKVMPEAPQNFKYVSWEKIRTALQLD